jgi:MoaA/NifB/PqqE/SkfB family radical SAM enzyme
MKPRWLSARADLRQINPRAVLNASLNYCEGLFRLARPRSYPLRLDLVLTKACNMRCIFCISYGALAGPRWMDFELYEQIAATLFPKALKVFICSGGEPLLYPRIREALNLARRYRTLTQMVSNGMLLDNETAQWLVADQSLHELTISFDGARKETVERIRRGADFQKILNQIAYLSTLRIKRRALYPRISLHYVIMLSNASELPEIFPLCAQYGISRVLVSYLNVCNDIDFQESMFNHRALLAQMFQEARRRARQWGVRLELPPLPGEDQCDQKCLYPWQFCQIDPDGSIRPCYHSWRQRLGFFHDGFAAVWHGDYYQKLRRTVDSQTPFYPYCRCCSVRLGVNREGSHHQPCNDHLYLIPGLETMQVPFNQRLEENISSWRERTTAEPG